MPNINPVELILAKREGKAISAKDIASFIENFMAGSIPEYQMSALLMAIFFQGLDAQEIASLTQSYIDSGQIIKFPAELIVADKHSTGGVGDKISLMLAPIAASLGLSVPMISGRGLGHTGGTLDKLESIPGFRTQYTPEEFQALVEKHGCALIGQSDALVPADKRIYALRDVTATVESLGLITASIMSKKIAEGSEHLVIDLKIGSGAFMPDLGKARELSKLLVSTGASFSQKVQVVFSNMNSPLGLAVGNALEMVEAIEYLKGNPLRDTKILTTELTARLLLSGGLAASEREAVDMIQTAVSSGKALAKLEEIITAQGGDPRVLDDYSLLGKTSVKIPVLAETGGYVKAIDARAIGYALVRIKAGRMQVSDSIDYGAGALLIPKIGDCLEKGEPIGEIHANDQAQAEEVVRLIRAAYTFSPEPIEKEELILDTM
ncbi:MAG: thymidine phosphorylase [Candidatus Cloacimonetes bacterium]|nr:thymidine phosphorylase [Candidatus Cloacimonadota bacterium]